MSKGKGSRAARRQPIPTRSPVASSTPPTTFQQMFMGYDPTKKTIPVDVVSVKVGWSEFVLADGATIRLKGSLIDVKRAVGQYAADGKPVYLMQMTLVNDLVVPDEMMDPKLKKQSE